MAASSTTTSASPASTAPTDSAWTVLPHGPLEQLSDNLWWVTGSLKGMSLKRSMTVVRRSDGTLVIHSAIAMTEDRMRELEALGVPAYLIVPNRGHRRDAPKFKKRYPALKVYAPRGGRKTIEERVPVDGTYDDFPADPAVRLEMLEGVNDEEGAMIVTSRDGVTVVLNDAVFNMDRKKDPLGFLFTTLLGSAPGPRVSRLVRHLFVKDKAAFRASLERLAQTKNLVRLVVAHEKVAHGPDASAALRKAASYL
jgi:hypothetical protein